MIQLTDKTLYQVTEKVNIEDDKAILELMSKANAVKNWLIGKHNALAVSFNQLGFTERCFVIKDGSKWGLPDTIINPHYSPAKSHKVIESEEACLSFPGQKFKIQRFNKIRMVFWDFKEGKHKKLFMSHLAGIICQHEICHLNGKPDDVLVKEKWKLS